MNTYHKFVPNVFLAKCTESHEKGEIINIENKYGKENECIVFNLIAHKGEFYYYSIVRADGFNTQEWARCKAERLETAAANAVIKSDKYYKASNVHSDFLALGEPIKVGHHSERRHRNIIEKAWNNMGKSVEYSKKAEDYESRVSYWEGKANTINLSMPECLDYYEFELEKAMRKHEGLKDGSIERSHSFSLTYAKKEVNELQKKVELAKRLWA